MSDDLRSFKDMQNSLRVGHASGMNTVITLDPDSALHLAEILDRYEQVLSFDLVAALDQLAALALRDGPNPSHAKR